MIILQKTLTERGPTKPKFLTVRDFEDGSLQCKVNANDPTVYALTICVPQTVYNRMKNEPTLKNLPIVKNAWFFNSY